MNVIAVVVTYNRLELLKRNLSCLRRQTVPLTTLVVVDNGSTDGTGAWLDEQEDVKTIHQTNVGGAGGFYTGMEYARLADADWIWCMDDDVFPRPDCLEQLLAYAGYEGVGILTPTSIHNKTRIFIKRPERGSEHMKLSELLNVLKTAETAEEMDVRREEIAALIPAVRTMFGYDQKNSAHQYDLWMHSLHVVCNLPRRMENDMVYLAALLHDIGKPEAQCRGKREGDPDMHYYGHPEKSMEIVRDIVVPELDRQGYVIPCFDVQELLYYVKYHDDHVSVKLKHVRRHTKMASFAMFQNLMLLQLADAKAHIQIPVIAERAEICGRLAGEEGRLLYQKILDGE